MAGMIEIIAMKIALAITGLYSGDLGDLERLLNTELFIERIIYTVGTLVVAFIAAFIVAVVITLIKEKIKTKKEKA